MKTFLKFIVKNLSFFQNSENYLLINPTEEAKSLDKFPKYIEECISKNLKRGQTVIANRWRYYSRYLRIFMFYFI